MLLPATAKVAMAIDDTLKVVVVGNAGAGKSCFVKHLIASGVLPHRVVHSDAEAPTAPLLGDAEAPSAPSRVRQSSALGLTLNEWIVPDQAGSDGGSAALKKVLVWDFEGGQSFHSAQEVFFTPQTLYVVVWDMAAIDIEGMEEGRPQEIPRRCSDSYGATAQSSAFKLGYDSDSDSDDDCDMDLYNQEEVRRSKRALEMDIDEKVQFWIDRIEIKVPGATIIPVATYADQFVSEAQQKEAKKRLKSLKERITWNEERRVQDLERRLKDASELEENENDTFRWIKLLSNRPNILFRPQGDGQPDLPCFVSNVCETCKSRDLAVEFVLSSSRALVREQFLYRPQLPTCARALQEACHRMKEQFKIVQTSYFAQQFCDQGTESDDLFRILEALHKSGELCYFGALVPQSSSLIDFVVTDPAWLVESIAYILRCASQVDGMNQLSSSTNTRNPSLEERVSKCPSIGREDVRMLWKNRSLTGHGLELAEQISSNATNDVFDFLEKLLVQNDIFVPLTFGQKIADSKHFFLPSLLWDRDVYVPNSEIGPLDLSGTSAQHILPNPSVFLSKAICHGLVFMDSVPTTFVERTTVHIIKELSAASAPPQGCCDANCKSPRISVEEFQCSKRSYQIKLAMDLANGDEDRNVEVQSFLLEAPKVNTNQGCSSGACQSMYITCIQGCWTDPRSSTLRREICARIRSSMQRALDEIPGLEYRDEGVCPECLTKKKSCGDVGTWSFAKLRTVLIDGETVIRCRLGHCIDTKIIKGLVDCQLDSPYSTSTLCSSKCCGKPTNIANAPSSDRPSLAHSLVDERRKGKPDEAETIPNKNLDNSLISTNGQRSTSRRMSNPLPDGPKSIPKPSPKMSRHVTHPALTKLSPEDEIIKQKLNARMDECEVSMKKRFFARKKNKLDFSNFALAQCQIPVKDLYQTNLGLNLHSLTLANNRLDGIPEKLVSCLPNLKSLDLSHNIIIELPTRWSLPNLKKLKLAHNLLVSFPSEVCLRYGMCYSQPGSSVFSMLTVNSHPSLFHFQSILLGLLSLEELNLSDNKLKTFRIPSMPEILGKLKTLDLSMNELTSLPNELSRLRTLKVLDVQFNAIDEVPKNVVSSMNSFLLQSGKNLDGDKNNRKNVDTKFRRGIASLSSNSSCSLPQECLYSKNEGKFWMSRETHTTVPVEEQGED